MLVEYNVVNYSGMTFISTDLDVCGCWPSCLWFAMYVVVGHRAIGLLQVLVTSPYWGGAVKIYN